MINKNITMEEETLQFALDTHNKALENNILSMTKPKMNM